MKLVVAVIHDRDRAAVCDALSNAGYMFTHIATTGGFLREGNITLLTAVEKEKVDHVVTIVRDNSKTREQYTSISTPGIESLGPGTTEPVKVKVGGATILVLNIEQFLQV